LWKTSSTEPFLEHLPGVHHDHPVARLGHHAQVVGDQDDAHPQLGLELVDELQDLRLDRHVERGGRLVGDQQLGVARERHGDHHALPHPAGKLVRVLVHALVRDGDAHQLQHLDGPGAPLLLVEPLVQPQRLHDLVAHGEHGVQRGHRLLEDHGDVVAADLPHPLLRRERQVFHLAVRSRKRMRDSGWIFPGGSGISLITESEVTDFPLPDSPTIPSVSPGFTWNDTPSTARANPASVLK
jgi:hypothetical protein